MASRGRVQAPYAYIRASPDQIHRGWLPRRLWLHVCRRGAAGTNGYTSGLATVA